jgi:four helix bundle protein
MRLKSYRDLIVWQKAMDLTVEIYSIVMKLPKTEIYALTDQMQRAAVSIPSNIAEGHMRNSTKEYLRFLSIAMGSKAELETQLLICVRLKYLSEFEIQQAMNFLEEISKMIATIMKTLRSRD